MIIINVYRPFLDKNAFLDQIIAFIAELKDNYPKHDIVCAGDFNVDLTKQSNFSETLIEQMISHGFIQQVTLPTRPGQNHSSLIDHVYTRSKSSISSSTDIEEATKNLESIITEAMDIVSRNNQNFE